MTQNRTLVVLLAAALAGAVLVISGCSNNKPESNNPDELFSEAVALAEDRAYADAEAKFERALGLYQQQGEGTRVCETYGQMAEVSMAVGRYHLAYDRLTTAVRLSKQAGDYREEARLTLRLGDVYRMAGEYRRAAMAYDTAYAINAAFNNVRGKAETDLRIGSLMLLLENTTRAAAVFDEAIQSFRTVEDSSGVAAACLERARVYTAVRRASDAMQLYARATTACSRINDPVMQTKIRLARGLHYRGQRMTGEALRQLTEGVAIARQNKASRAYAPIMLFYLSRTAADAGNAAQARSSLEEALTEARSQNDPLAEAYLTLAGVAAQERALGTPQKNQETENVIRGYSQAAARFHEFEHGSGEAYALTCAARLREAAGDAMSARRALERAAEILEGARGEYCSEELHAPYQEEFGMAAAFERVHASLAELAMATNDPGAAFQTLERRRLLNAFRLLRQSAAVVRHPKLAEEVTTLRTSLLDKRLFEVELAGVLARRAHADLAAAAMARRQIAALDGLIAQRAEYIARQYPNYDQILRVAPVPVSQAQLALPRGTMAVDILPARDRLYIFTLTRTAFRYAVSPVRGDQVRSLVQEYRRALFDPRVYAGSEGEESMEPMMRFEALSAQLYDVFLRPIEGTFEKNLLFLCSREFENFPFHALAKQTAGKQAKYLIEFTNVDYLPSLTSLRFRTADPARLGSLTAFGNPSGKNWSVDYELRDLRSLVKRVTLYIGGEATWSMLEQTMGDVLQLATDCTMPTSADFGTFALAEEGSVGVTLQIPFERLTELPAFPLVLLSNQLTETVPLGSEQGMLLRVNGTSDVIYNAWHADRKGAKFFSEYFFTHLAEGLAPGDAYRQALLNMLKTREIRHPRSWAQFFHLGVG